MIEITKTLETDNNEVVEIISKYINLSVTPFGQATRTVVRVDKRSLMYGGNGIVYLLQMILNLML